MMYFSAIFNILSLLIYLIWALDIVKYDLENNKIPNKKIIKGFKILLFLFSLSFIASVMGEKGINISYFKFEFYKMYALNFFLSLFAALVLWYGEIWPAGDAKFFVLVLSFIPFINENAAGFPRHLWLSILINIFFVSGILAIVKFIVETFQLWRREDDNAFLEIRQAIEKAKKWINENNILEASIKALIVILSVGIVFIAHQVVNIYLRKFIISHFKRTDIFYFIMFFLWDKLSILFQNKIWKIILFSLYILYFLFGWLYFRMELLNYIQIAFSNVLKFGIILLIGRFVFEYLIERRNVVFVSKEELKPGMVLSSKEVKTLRTDSDLKELFEDYFKDGLSVEQVEGLKKWLEKHPVKDAKLEVIKGRAFGLWIFLGSLIEIIFNKNILTWLR